MEENNYGDVLVLVDTAGQLPSLITVSINLYNMLYMCTCYTTAQGMY